MAHRQDGAAGGKDVAEGQDRHIGRAQGAGQLLLRDAVEPQHDARVGNGTLLQLTPELLGQRLAADEQPVIRAQLRQAGEGVQQLAHVLVATDGPHEGEDPSPGRQAQGPARGDGVRVHVVVAKVVAVRQHVQSLEGRGARRVALDEPLARHFAVQDDGVGALDETAMRIGIVLVRPGFMTLEVVHGPDDAHATRLEKPQLPVEPEDIAAGGRALAATEEVVDPVEVDDVRPTLSSPGPEDGGTARPLAHHRRLDVMCVELGGEHAQVRVPGVGGHEHGAQGRGHGRASTPAIRSPA